MTILQGQYAGHILNYNIGTPIRNNLLSTLPYVPKFTELQNFLPKQDYTKEPEYDGIYKVEHYIEHTKREINEQLPNIFKGKQNVTSTEQKTIRKLRMSKSEITIKPTDKNLGIVILNTNDYIE